VVTRACAGQGANMWPVVAHGSALDAWTCPRGEVPGLGLTDEDIGLLRG
jgi:hypothetical protein